MIHARDDYNDGRIVDTKGKIPEDEPVFLLRGQDPFAVDMINHYIKLHLEHYGPGPITQQLEKHIQRVINWPVKKKTDLPDEVTETGRSCSTS